jgi:hypothetical protein
VLYPPWKASYMRCGGPRLNSIDKVWFRTWEVGPALGKHTVERLLEPFHGMVCLDVVEQGILSTLSAIPRALVCHQNDASSFPILMVCCTCVSPRCYRQRIGSWTVSIGSVVVRGLLFAPKGDDVAGFLLVLCLSMWSMGRAPAEETGIFLE